MKSFLQSEFWEEFQNQLGNKTVRLKSGHLGIVERGRFANRLYFPLSPDFTEASIEEAKKVAKENSVDFLRADFVNKHFQSDAVRFGFRRAHSDSQPAWTAIAKVDGDFEEVSRRISKSQRKMFRHATQKGVEFSFSENHADIDFFLKHIKSVQDRTGMIPRSDSYFHTFAKTLFSSGHAGLIIATLNGEKIASKIVIIDDETLTCLHSGSFSAFRELSISAAMNFWTLQFANQRGLKFVDFFGVAPPEEVIKETHSEKKWKSWQGFTRFKLSFGAERVELGGTWEMSLPSLTSRVKCSLYRILRTLLG